MFSWGWRRATRPPPRPGRWRACNPAFGSQTTLTSPANYEAPDSSPPRPPFTPSDALHKAAPQWGLPKTPESSPSPRRNLTEKPSEGSGAAQPFSTSTFSGFILSICQREGRKRAPSQMAAREIPASQPAQARCPSEAGRGMALPGPPRHQEQSGAAEAHPAGSGINAANTASGTMTYPWVFIDQKAPKSFP